MSEEERKSFLNQSPELKKSIQVEFRENDLKGYFFVQPGTFQKFNPSVKDITVILIQKGFQYGLDQSIVEAVVSRNLEGKWVEAAWGKPASEGQDGRIDYQFDTRSGPLPAADERGQVNLKELHRIENVVKDQLLAVHYPPVRGEPGITVRGKQISPPAVKDVVLRAGKNTRLSDDKRELYSTIDGMIVMKNGIISVEPVYVCSGDIGPSTGNVHFVGKVIVNGSVLDGFTVKAAEEILVEGTVGAAVIESGRSVLIKGGVNGKNSGSISGTDISAKFINQADIHASGNVTVNDYIMHSRVFAGGAVILNSGKGAIIGGRTVASRGINALVLGAEAEPRTVIEAGLPYEIVHKFQKVEDDFIRLRRFLIQSEKDINTLKRLEQQNNLDDEKEARLLALVSAHKKCQAQILALLVDASILKNRLKEPVEATIRAGTAYPEVEFLSPLTRLKLNDHKQNLHLELKDGKLIAGGTP